MVKEISNACEAKLVRAVDRQSNILKLKYQAEFSSSQEILIMFPFIGSLNQKINYIK